MYNTIPLILILLSLGVIIFIIIRKFPILANLDVDNIPSNKEEKLKEKILSNRIKRNFIKWKSIFLKILEPIWNVIFKSYNWLLVKLNKIKENYRKEPIFDDSEINQRISQLFSEVEAYFKKENYIEAEKKLIEIIGLDNKNIEAFKLLGKVYFEKKDYEEARETYEYVLKIIDNNLINSKENNLSNIEKSKIYFSIAEILFINSKFNEALTILNKALKLEPENPRYLDMMLEISIINKDKVFALDAWEKLKKTNPENQKLNEYKRQIDDL